MSCVCVIVVYGCQSQEGYLEEGAAPSGTVPGTGTVPQILYVPAPVLSFCVSMELIDLFVDFSRNFGARKLLCAHLPSTATKCEWMQLLTVIKCEWMQIFTDHFSSCH